MRKSIRQQKAPSDDLAEAVSTVGGRLLYLNKVSKARNAVEMAKHMLSVEKAWLLSQIGLIPDCDDDVMDEVLLLLSVLMGDTLISTGLAKMEFVFVAVVARIRQVASGARTCVGGF